MLREEDTGGLTIKFGDAETMVKIVRMIAEREGFGNVLAEGSEKASEKLGKGKEFLTTSKGQEAPAHMPQVKRSLALIYAVNPFGADHESSDHDLTYDETGFAAYKDRYTTIRIDKSAAYQEPASLVKSNSHEWATPFSALWIASTYANLSGDHHGNFTDLVTLCDWLNR